MEYDPKNEIRNKFLRLALRRIDGEEYSQGIIHRHAAVVVKAGRVLSVGRNRDKTHPDAVGVDEDGEVFTRTIHAEMDAFSRVKNKNHLKGATIYVARKGRNDEAGMSCPCKMCQGLISKYGLKKAVFTTEYGTGTIEFTGEDR
jgi:deoxycytidylate deaminase|tara:strand:- start:3212 stop:3643 length:432 start_codon:yes stop_codon:yes gene_type:complete